ncbi:hypothetical protein QYF61_002676 [Mycteria americana]|uniref:SGNH hydrolase-type esterase domain-containing protein n=1 Tax=Mycteria americana TaxID=33587 RepID=A0AAN7NRN4_MYCAM|nr:hypothetical protein QYF61_002676 [Mycteria americana]
MPPPGTLFSVLKSKSYGDMAPQTTEKRTASVLILAMVTVTNRNDQDLDSNVAAKTIIKQPQFPQPLLIRLLLQTLHQLQCPSLDTLQYLNVSLVVRGPKLNTGFDLWAVTPEGTEMPNHAWLRGWCHRHGFVFFDNGMAYTAPGLLASDGIHLSQRGKRIFAQELAGLIDRALN